MVKLNKFCCTPARQKTHPVSGFTLLESLIVMAIIAIVGAIASSSWLYLMLVLNLNTAQDEVIQALRKTQQNARLNRIVWEFGIRQNSNGQVQWAIYPDGTTPESLLWKNLDSRIQLDQETSLAEVRGVYRVQFNHLGAVNGQLGRVTLSSKNSGRTKRCVIVSTLLGAIRTGSDKATAVNNKYCR